MKRVLFLGGLAILFSCSKPSDPPPGGNDPDPDPNPNPSQSLTITSLTPDRGSATVSVTITGTGFNTTPANNQVTLDNLVATVNNASATQLVISLPANITGGSYDVTVKANGKTATKTDGFHCIDWMVSTFAGTGASGVVNGPANQAQFRNPVGITADANGNLYLADDHFIRKITPAGVVSTYAGNGSRGNADGNAASASFNFPRSIAVDAAGNLYLADQWNHSIRKISTTGSVTTIAGSINPGSSNGIGAAASFNLPYGIAVNPQGTVLYVGDHANHRIRKINLLTNEVSYYAGSGSNDSKDGNGLNAGIPWPGGLYLTSDGTLYVTERGAGKIRKITPAGDVTTVGGFLSVSSLPVHLVVDKDENTYVLYKANAQVKKYTKAGIESVAFGKDLIGDEDGPASQASFFNAEGITLIEQANGTKTFYISDSGNKKIKKITLE